MDSEDMCVWILRCCFQSTQDSDILCAFVTQEEALIECDKLNQLEIEKPHPSKRYYRVDRMFLGPFDLDDECDMRSYPMLTTTQQTSLLP
jgi:hypothetical protein